MDREEEMEAARSQPVTATADAATSGSEPSAAFTPETMRDGIARGHEFAERLYELVAETGPSDLSSAEQVALGSHLVNTTILWVRARNLAKAEGRS